MFTRSERRMKKILVLTLCLLSLLACAKRPAPAPVTTAPAVLPQFAHLNDLYGQFQGFRNDRLYLRHGFTANFPQSDWLQRVRELDQDPELAERARLLASLAIASRIHGDDSQVTRSFEKRFTASLYTPGPPLSEEEGAPDAIADAELSAQPPQMPAAQAENTTKEPSRAGDITTSEGPEQPQQAESSTSAQVVPASQPAAAPAPSDQIGEGQTVEIPAPIHAQPLTAPIESANVLASVEPTTMAETEGPQTSPVPAPTRQLAEEHTPSPSPDAGSRTLPATSEAVVSTGATDAQAAAPTTPAPIPEQAVQPATNPSENNTKITVLFTGDTQGVVFPQPGITGPVGGIAQRLPVIERVRAEAAALVLLDAGDAFVSGFPRAERINKTLVRAMNRMGYDAMGLGPYDLEMGEVPLRELASIASFPFVCSNLEFQKDALPWIRPYVLIKRGQYTIAVISLVETNPAVKITGAHLIAPELALNKLMPQLVAKADAIVLLTQTGRDEILPLLGSAPDVGVILGDARSASQDTPRYVPAVAKGMGMVLVELNKSDGIFQPGRSVPLVASGASDLNLLRMLDEIQN
ncbi:hypothetical protein JCM14713_14190 [Desulfomicrobium salsuginis]